MRNQQHGGPEQAQGQDPGAAVRQHAGRAPRAAALRGPKSTWSGAATRQSALREAEQGMRASWTERAEQLSIDREVSARSLDRIFMKCGAPCLRLKGMKAGILSARALRCCSRIQ